MTPEDIQPMHPLPIKPSIDLVTHQIQGMPAYVVCGMPMFVAYEHNSLTLFWYCPIHGRIEANEAQFPPHQEG